MLLEFIYGLSVFGFLLLLAYSILKLSSGQKIEIGKAGSPKPGAAKPSAASKKIYCQLKKGNFTKVVLEHGGVYVERNSRLREVFAHISANGKITEVGGRIAPLGLLLGLLTWWVVVFWLILTTKDAYGKMRREIIHCMEFS